MGGLSLVNIAMKRVSLAWKTLRGTAREDWDAYFGTDLPITKAGTRIREGNALTISALFAGLNFLASTMATLPKGVFRRLPGGGSEHAYDHPMYDRLHNKANNSGLSSWQWFYTSIMHKYLWGNWYTMTNLQEGLIPLLPGRTWRDPDDLEIYHTIMKNGAERQIPQKYMLHIPHISIDGVTGKGVVHYARESLGLAKAQDEFAATFFGSGIHAGGFVKVDKPMEEDVRQGLQKDFNEKYGGLGRTWKAIFLTGGAEFKESEIDAQKAQVLESRQYSVVEVARWVNLPPHILRDLVRATFSNIEQQALELVIYSLLPLVTQIEQAMNIALFNDTERRTYYVKFELKGLLRGDLQARTAFYTAMLDRGVYNADIVLDLEDMNPQPNGLGKFYILPLNMVNKEQIVSERPLTITASQSAHNVTPQIQRIASHRSVSLRRKITQAYMKQFETYGKKIVTDEVKRIREGIQEMLKERNAVNFLEWLNKFYQEEFSKEIDRAAAPLLTSYAETILPVALEEINSQVEIGPQYQQFQAQYRDYFITRHINSSLGQLKTLAAQAQEEESDLEEMLEQRLLEWEEKRPGKISIRESVRAENAFTRQAFALAGVTLIRSVAYGHNCPYCDALNGKVIGIEENFLSKGDFQPDGADAPLKVTSDHSHPPYHDGCDCSIVIGI